MKVEEFHKQLAAAPAAPAPGADDVTTEADLLPLPEGEASSFGNYKVHDNEAMIEYARANVARNRAVLRAENEALREEVERLRTDGASAVRWAPGSAYWSEVLVELFGPDARKGIDALETRWRKELERAERLAEVLSKILENEASDWKAAEEFGGYVLDDELREEARAALSKENNNET